ncbi:hypothetical protein PHJA_001578600 [Phtheirospermum japonicum]|uniref:Uncharacterized protein n=1 Tax=Phtheirospermum japonicum TaxID=374723 RepID=A0A830CIV5_9LAMI|nr:hypothetical protein PHJA_001578600 [Phtheirospermum japonicum]
MKYAKIFNHKCAVWRSQSLVNVRRSVWRSQRLVHVRRSKLHKGSASVAPHTRPEASASRNKCEHARSFRRPSAVVGGCWYHFRLEAKTLELMKFSEQRCDWENLRNSIKLKSIVIKVYPRARDNDLLPKRRLLRYGHRLSSPWLLDARPWLISLALPIALITMLKKQPGFTNAVKRPVRVREFLL